jgi:hypothetical protein
MAGQGTLVVATDYNTIQSKIQAVFGDGGTNPNTGLPDGSFGYGQTLVSIPVSANAKVSVTQWNNLRTDLVKARQHQLGITVGTKESSDPLYVPGQDLKIPTTANKVTETDRASFNQMADYVISDRLVAAAGQLSRDTVSNLTYSSNWSATITHSVTMTFSTTNRPRNFFNAGGYVDITASQLITGTNTKNDAWKNLINTIGVVTFSRTTTTTTGSGTASAIGFTQLTTSDQLIYQKLSSAYSPNVYRIYARIGATANILIFTIQFADLNTPADPTWGIDEVITGSVTSKVETVRATGTNVSSALPTITASFT